MLIAIIMHEMRFLKDSPNEVRRTILSQVSVYMSREFNPVGADMKDVPDFIKLLEDFFFLF